MVAIPPHHAMFRGINSVTLDAKGRMALPARHREAIRARSAGRLVTTIDRLEPSLLVYPLPDWEALQARLQKMANMHPPVRILQRLLIGHATDMELDANGRVLLPQMLREHAELERKLVVVGQGNKIEIWNESNWQERMENWLGKDLETALEQVGDLEGLSI